MKRSEYQAILEQTHIWSNQPAEEQEKAFNKLNEYVQSMVPKKLFRFRDCSERSIDAFFKNQIWASSGDTMNDDFDARMFFRVEELEKWIEEQEGIKPIKELLQYHSATGEIPAPINAALPNICILFQQANSMPDKTPSESPYSEGGAFHDESSNRAHSRAEEGRKGL